MNTASPEAVVWRAIALLWPAETDAIVPGARRGAFAAGFVVDHTTYIFRNRLTASDIQRHGHTTGGTNADLMRHTRVLVCVERKAHGTTRVGAARDSLTALQARIECITGGATLKEL